ncbi:MAG: low affinity iron permease family protein [Vicinamibacterales bacterium]
MRVTAPARSSSSRLLESISSDITAWTGSTSGFVLAVAVVLAWAISGPFFGFSETWQLVINTGTTIVTFLMVFLIQRAQNKDALALQLKVNEIVAATLGASNRLIAIENLTEHDLHVLRVYYAKLAEMARADSDVAQSHSVEEARERHQRKRQRRRAPSQTSTSTRDSGNRASK